MIDTRPLFSLRNMPTATVGGFVIALFSLPVLSLASSGLQGETVIALQWLCVSVIVGLVLFVEGESLASIGFRRPAWIDLGYLFGTTVVALTIFVVAGPLLQEVGLPTDEGATGIGAETSFAVAIVAALTVGVVEEILYRGYAIERVLDYSNSPLVAGGISWLGFTLAHAVVWSLGNLVQIAAVTALFTVVYLRRRTLFPVVGAHVLIWVLPVFEQFFG